MGILTTILFRLYWTRFQYQQNLSLVIFLLGYTTKLHIGRIDIYRNLIEGRSRKTNIIFPELIWNTILRACKQSIVGISFSWHIGKCIDLIFQQTD